ncbi:lysophospholipid acyltransferase family protein [Rhodoferax sp.]|jgi:KDO2-lipid IV(A) lauroyltransferase|uniref:lysophospholipid acyltransferase family protein n=1 Tax=Rhodoferax sp. TaxID=50421 RepID=UPI003784C715
MTALFRLLSYLPLWLLHAGGVALGWLAFLVSGSYRQRLLVHASLAGVGRNAWMRAVGEAGKLVAELPRLWLGPAVPVEWDGEQHIRAALAAGRGIVFLTPHLGCFEVTAQAYAQRFGQSERAMTVLYRAPRKAWLARLVVASRARPGLHTVPATLAGVKQLLKALKTGNCVGLLPDQVPPQHQGLWTPFFGKPAYTMTLSARLALQADATVLLAWGERLPWGRGYLVHVSPWAGVAHGSQEQGLDADLECAVRQINQAMEALILAHPSQYLWGYDRYKQPKEGG